MGFKNKIILFIVISFLLVISLSAGFFYLQKKYNIFNTSSDTTKSEIKSACLRDFEGINEEYFIEKIKNLSNVNEEELTEIKKNMLSYLECKLDKEREKFDKHIYPMLANRALKSAYQLNLSENLIDAILNEDSLLKKMLFYYSNNEQKILDEKYTIVNNIALSPINVICPNNEESDYVFETCLNSGALLPERKDKISEEIFNEAESRCNNLCENIERYSNDWSNFEKDNENFPWSDDDDLLGVQFLMRSALSFRVGGKELALNLCDSILKSDFREKCKQYVISLDYINCKEFGFNEIKECGVEKYEDCEVFYNNAKNLICESYIEK